MNDSGRLATERIIHLPHFSPCVHTIRGEDLIPPLGWEKSGAEARKCERAPGEAPSSLIAKAAGGSGDGEAASACPYATAAPIKRKSALGDCLLSFGILRASLPSPLWVKSGHSSRRGRCPLCVRKRTCVITTSMSALCQSGHRAAGSALGAIAAPNCIRALTDFNFQPMGGTAGAINQWTPAARIGGRGKSSAQKKAAPVSGAARSGDNNVPLTRARCFGSGHSRVEKDPGRQGAEVRGH